MTVWDFALQNEADGIEYYSAKAEENKENALHRVFTMLIKDEQRHYDLLEHHRLHAGQVFPSDDALASLDSLFKDPESLIQDVYTAYDQLKTYKMALEIEKKGIDLYHKLASEAEDPEHSRLFSFLRSQELQHYELFEELIKRVSRPEEWVEAAEFGHREEY
ncbi:MAG: ferritin family protein [Clostridiaceae bacterium]|nr:ferritin family protein [Clostridiaceae bacterium]